MEYASPIPYAYWVRPHQLLAGAHPAALSPEMARETMRELLAANVTVLIDLTEDGEYEAYSQIAHEEAAAAHQTVQCWHFPIPDRGTPSSEQMTRILDTIDEALAAGKGVYVHCLAGIGRTGTVVGCYLVRHGRSGDEALHEIMRRRRGLEYGDMLSPETMAQCDMVLDWMAGR